MYELYGIRPEDFSETFEAWEAGIHPEDLATFRQAIAQALNGEEDFDSEFRVLWPDGTVRFVEAHAIVQRDGGRLSPQHDWRQLGHYRPQAGRNPTERLNRTPGPGH